SNRARTAGAAEAKPARGVAVAWESSVGGAGQGKGTGTVIGPICILGDCPDLHSPSADVSLFRLRNHGLRPADHRLCLLPHSNSIFRIGPSVRPLSVKRYSARGGWSA